MENTKQIWDLFTSKEEYHVGIRDKFNRHPYYLSQNRNIFKPAVSEFLLQNGLQPKYPDNKKFAVCLTHDVDFLYETHYLKTFKRHTAESVKNLLTLNIQSLKNTWAAVSKKEIKSAGKSIIRKINPQWSLSKTLAISKKYNAKSSFYFLSLPENEDGFNYHLEEIEEVFAELDRNQSEIGLHGGHSAYNNLTKLQEEKIRLEKATGKKIEGYRNHYLRFEVPTTWQNLEKLGFRYDTTFGYADCIGFRNGTCHPFQPYNYSQNNFLNIMELPLIIMDGTLSRYMNLDDKAQFKLCKQLIDTVEENNGVLTLLWHNNEMDGKRGELYQAILKYISEKNAWMGTAKEVVDWWEENKYNQITRGILEDLKKQTIA